ncbi:hypothetical protein C475_17898 [Halosimplex carlsbadense 2-9-1]|uniref:Uncharacterized protein n=1 Tax=Halosimplex carlsbadense 2-9-1 TaxID=797114 RepID=M0CGJ9_9EURY|nr:hypothetical protein [Halosimplex carlsbadense]ELZ22410.1 hypothetical protein C475_17898 [Halosimplex carlsbadense 2-9-1]
MSSSGSRLPGDSESADRHKSEERAEARLSGDLAARFTDYLDAHGEAKSEVVREALDEYLPASERSQYVLPSDPELADAYLALAGEEPRTLSVNMAEDILSRESHPNTPKELIRSEVLDPLAASGLISVRCGKVGVRPLTERDEIAEGIDGE